MVLRDRGYVRLKQFGSLLDHASTEITEVCAIRLAISNTARYLLLLEDIARNTEKSHPDYSNLVTAHMYIKRAADSVNTSEYSMSKMV